MERSTLKATDRTNKTRIQLESRNIVSAAYMCMDPKVSGKSAKTISSLKFNKDDNDDDYLCPSIDISKQQA